MRPAPFPPPIHLFGYDLIASVCKHVCYLERMLFSCTRGGKFDAWSLHLQTVVGHRCVKTRHPMEKYVPKFWVYVFYTVVFSYGPILCFEKVVLPMTEYCSISKLSLSLNPSYVYYKYCVFVDRSQINLLAFGASSFGWNLRYPLWI